MKNYKDDVEEAQLEDLESTYNETAIDLSYLKDIVSALTSEKLEFKAKFSGADFDKPRARIKEITRNGVIHIDFNNKMKI